LDANGNFSINQALALIEKLDLESFEYFEQPVATISEMRELRLELQKRQIPMKIAADELIRRAADPYLVTKQDACDIAVLKVQSLGGIEAAQKIANEIGIDVVVSSALESSIGLTQGLHYAASLKNLNYDCGLGTAALLAGDVTDKPLIPSEGLLEVREVTPSPELIEKYQAAPERRDWWLARIDRCLEILES
ncbi:MAG: enolase C-terminal domain-like protein, partial [bacterium]